MLGVSTGADGKTLSVQGSNTSKVRPRGKVKSPGSVKTADRVYTPTIAMVLSGREIVIFLELGSKAVVRKARSEPPAAIVRVGFPQAPTGGPE